MHYSSAADICDTVYAPIPDPTAYAGTKSRLLYENYLKAGPWSTDLFSGSRVHRCDSFIQYARRHVVNDSGVVVARIHKRRRDDMVAIGARFPERKAAWTQGAQIVDVLVNLCFETPAQC